MGDVVGLEAGKALPAGGFQPAEGVRLHPAEHGPGQLQNGLGAVRLRDLFRLRQGQDQLFHPVQGFGGHLRPCLKPGPEGGPGWRGAAGQGRHLDRLDRPGVQHLPLLQQGVQRLPAQLVDGAARQIPRAALHLDLDLPGGEGGAPRLGQAAAQRLGGVGAGGLGPGLAIDDGPAALPVGGGQFFAALLHFQLEVHRHAGPLPPVQLPQGGQSAAGLGGVGLAAGAEHGAVDLSVQIA